MHEFRREYRKRYSSRLANYVYLHPDATVEDVEAEMRRQNISSQQDAEARMRAQLRQHEQDFADAYGPAVDAGLDEVLPLEMAWAAEDTVDGNAGSCSPTRMTAAYGPYKERLIRRWARDVTRKRPFGACLGPRRPSSEVRWNRFDRSPGLSSRSMSRSSIDSIHQPRLRRWEAMTR